MILKHCISKHLLKIPRFVPTHFLRPTVLAPKLLLCPIFHFHQKVLFGVSAKQIKS